MRRTSLFKIILALLFLISNQDFANSTYPKTKKNKTLLANIAPIITASGNQIYCPQTSLKIVTDVTITDPDDISTDAIYIQISSGYVNGQDQLSLTNLSLHPTIITSWDSSSGKLKLYSPTGNPVLYTEFIDAIKDVEFSNSTASPSGSRSFSITIGQANYLPLTGHYYQFVPSLGITWTNALTAAAASNYYGLQGYLATITSLEESQLAGKQSSGAGWIGGNDISTQNVWRWVTGPEGLANGGTGTVFWNGGVNGSSPTFAFWNMGEPNNVGGIEHYAHITAPGVGTPGSWNDLSNTGSISGDYQPKGYIVEYGGMPGDPILQISASTRITIPKITGSRAATNCGPGSLTLQATASNGTINWYSTPTSTTSLYTGNSFDTPYLTTTTIYYVDAGCISTRIPVIATVTPLPTPLNVNDISYCQFAPTAPLTATASINCTLNWYTVSTGGIPSTTRPIPSSATVGSTKYYVSQTNTVNGCEGARSEIVVTVNPLPIAPIVNDFFYCQNETTGPLTTIASANCTLNWYTVATGGNSVSTNPTPNTTNTGITTYYVSQTETTTGCEGARSVIKITVNSLPTAPLVNGVVYCQNETTTPLTAIASVNCDLNWYTTKTGGISTSTSPTPSSITIGATKYYVSQTITATGCEGPRSEITVIVNALPIVNNASIIQCDSDLISDGKTLFNLTVNNDVISVNYMNENFSYYTSLNGATNAVQSDQITNELAFENTVPTSMDVWARVANKTTNCYSVAKLSLKVPATNINPNYKIIILPVCDDLLDSNGNNNANNNNRDGIATFNFSSTRATIQALLPSTDVYTINYYRNQLDALSELNVINDISNYRNIGYPNTQDIWVRIDSNLDNACYGLGPYLTLNIEALPFANLVTIPSQCDDNNDGIFTFTTSTLEADLLQGQMNVTASYFDQNNNPLKDANGLLITSPFPANFTTTSQIIKAVVTNNSALGCFDETTIEFRVDISPNAFTVPIALTTVCDDEPDPLKQDGKFAFDTTTFETIILGGQSGMTVNYFDANGNALPSPLPNPFVTATQNITAKVINPLNANCSATSILSFVVIPIPNIDLNLDGKNNELVCSNLSSFFVTLNAGFQDNSSTSDFTYSWTKDGLNLGTNSPTLEVNTVGLYTVEVTNQSGCSRTRTIAVFASNIATINSIDIVDLTDVNSITVNTTGPGNYQYSLDDLNGLWQDSNFFDNVPAGIHEIFINDKNGCGVVSKEVVVVGVPKYFTPNNDSYNDSWGIKGITKYPKAIINIFDRYGKFIKTLTFSSPTWDGTLNGSALPADDYWYVLKLDDTQPEIRGHFSLKR